MLIPMLAYLVLSDIHLGHKKNKIEDVIEHLRFFFNKYDKIISETKIIFIAGDLYDRLLASSSYENILATEWITELINYCSERNIKLRVLEGTPSHDWKQAVIIDTIIKKLNIDIDFKYIKTLEIEYMSDYGINILYIPDEYKHDASETLKEVKQLMKDRNLEQVDIAIMHGQFRYQIPMMKDSPVNHNEDEYLKLVKYYISVGHIHTPSVFDRILAQGSFDRNAHNEEEKKGGMLIKIFSTGDMEYKFLENTEATGFYTLDYKDKDAVYIIKDLEKKLKKYKPGTHIRIIADKTEYLVKSIKEISKKYNQYIIKIESKKVEEEKHNAFEYEIENDFISITPDNVIDLIKPSLSKYDVDIDMLLYDLEETIKEVL